MVFFIAKGYKGIVHCGNKLALGTCDVQRMYAFPHPKAVGEGHYPLFASKNLEIYVLLL